MEFWQAVIQLGLGGLVVGACYKLARMAMAKWRESDAERIRVYAESESARTAVLRESLGELVASIREHSIADLGSHAQITEGMARLDGKLDAVLDRYAPSNGVPRGEFDNERSTPVESPHAARTKVAKQPRGLYSIRKPTNGED